MSNEQVYGLDDAYSVETPQDNIQLYSQWAASYDSDFAQQRGYQYPQEIAELYQSLATETDAPILDVGAGTGLVAEQLLKLLNVEIDAIDISPEMLAQSQAKNLYRKYIQADLSQALSLGDNTYGGIISAGTFTHGHVGPKAF